MPAEPTTAAGGDPRPGDAFAGRRVLVTGAHGLVGGWLCARLLELGARVVVVRRDRSDRRSMLETEDLERRCTVVRGDIVEPGLVERAIAEHGCDTVFHLAAQTIVATAKDDPLETFRTNIQGTWLLMEACRARGVERVVVGASVNAYGSSSALPYVEQQALQPRYPYDVSKACADLVARCYWPTYGVPVATTRLASVYGGGDMNGSRLVPGAVASVLRDERPVIRSDGSTLRDFIYVEDAVEAYLAVADALDADGGGGPVRARGEAFNAGGGRSYNVLDVVEAVCRVSGTGLRPDVRGTGTPDREIEWQVNDSTKLRELTGWSPRVSLDDGIERTIAWYRTRGAALAPTS